MKTVLGLLVIPRSLNRLMPYYFVHYHVSSMKNIAGIFLNIIKMKGKISCFLFTVLFYLFF